jgi:hypothetical protein
MNVQRHFAVSCALLVLSIGAGCTAKTDTDESTLSMILGDRPRLAETLAGHEQVKNWVESRFKPGALPVELMWDPGEPQGGQPVEHEYLSPDGPAAIRIGSGFSGLDQLTGLIYDLNNIEDYPEFQVIYDSAVSGDIDRGEYARLMLAQEFAGLQKTRAFLDRHLADHLGDSVNENPMYFRIMKADTSLDAHIERYSKGGFNLQTYYEQMYDQEIVPKREQG